MLGEPVASASKESEPKLDCKGIRTARDLSLNPNGLRHKETNVSNVEDLLCCTLRSGGADPLCAGGLAPEVCAEIARWSEEHRHHRR